MHQTKSGQVGQIICSTKFIWIYNQCVFFLDVYINVVSSRESSVYVRGKAVLIMQQEEVILSQKKNIIINNKSFFKIAVH